MEPSAKLRRGVAGNHGSDERRRRTGIEGEDSAPSPISGAQRAVARDSAVLEIVTPAASIPPARDASLSWTVELIRVQVPSVCMPPPNPPTMSAAFAVIVVLVIWVFGTESIEETTRFEDSRPATNRQVVDFNVGAVDVDDAVAETTRPSAVDDREQLAGALDPHRLRDIEIPGNGGILTTSGPREAVGPGRQDDEIRPGGCVGVDHRLAQRAVPGNPRFAILSRKRIVKAIDLEEVGACRQGQRKDNHKRDENDQSKTIHERLP